MISLVLALTPGCGFFGYDALRVAGDTGVDAGLDASTDTGVDTGFDAGLDCDLGQCRRVFVTSAGLTAASVGSVMTADDFCQAAATGAGLGGLYKAWISDGSTTAAARLAHASVPYVLRDGTHLAEDWNDLVDGTLAHAIDITEAGDPQVAAVRVWTATTASGAYSGASCADWTNTTSSMPFGGAGSTNSTTQWSYVNDVACDQFGLRLYCLQQ